MHTPPEEPSAADGPVNRPPGRDGRPRLWLISGTGEGPPLATALLARGWRLRVSLVTAAAARAYPRDPHLEMAIGALGEGGTEPPEVVVGRELQRARNLGDPFRWLVDASHPFARRISATLAAACCDQHQPLLRLQRPPIPPGRAQVLDDLCHLGDHLRPGERFLLAIGARRLAEAIRHSPQALHHARVLPAPQALRQAFAAGLATDRLAGLRPSESSEAIEEALCRRWRIDTVLCRQSGGDSEGRWHRLCERLDQRLLLLRRPAEPAGVTLLAMEALLARIGGPEPG